MSQQTKTRPTAATVKRAEMETAAGQAAISYNNFIRNSPGRQSAVDIFEDVRRLVTAREVAEFYGFSPNRSGFICCPFHQEKTPSLKLFPDGGWKCFGCGKGGSVIDFAAELFDLSPLDAVRRLNSDFNLSLPLDKPPNEAERKAAQRKREISDSYHLFEQWRDDMIKELNSCFREGHLAMKSLTGPEDFDRLTDDAQALAIREQARFEWLADVLTNGTMAEQMQVFRDRKEVTALCNQILKPTPMKSGAA